MVVLCIWGLNDHWQWLLVFRPEDQGAWTALTAQLVHWNNYHLLMNIAGLWLLMLVQLLLGIRISFLVYLLAYLACSLGLLFQPELAPYAGLSAFLYAWSALLILAVSNLTVGVRAVFYGLVALWLFSEWFGWVPGHLDPVLIDSQVATSMHLWGWFSSLVIYLIVLRCTMSRNALAALLSVRSLC